MTRLQAFFADFRRPVSKVDRILEIVTLFLTIVIWVFAILIYRKTTGKIPTHFNFAGEVDSYGSVSNVWFVAGVYTFLVLLALLSAYKPQWNFQLKKGFTPQMKRNDSRMARVTCVFMGVVFLETLLSMGGKALGISFNQGIIVIIVLVALLLLYTVYYAYVNRKK